MIVKLALKSLETINFLIIKNFTYLIVNMSNPTDIEDSSDINWLEQVAEKELKKSFYWFQRAAENGDKVAMNNLARCYENGVGTEKDVEKAFYWHQKAAENGDKVAMNNLARCYKNGVGTEKNLEKAFYW